MLNLYNISVNDIMSLFKSAYFAQFGETLKIGSSEFNAASVFTYALSVLINNLNDSAKQRWLETATGEYLDALAASYGVSRPQGYKATTVCHLDTTWPYPTVIPAEAIKLQDESGRYTFINPYPIELNGAVNAVFQCVEVGSEYNGIPIDTINVIVEGSGYISAASNIVSTSGGTDSMQDDDEAFRTWLVNEIKSFAGAGTYLAYEGRARNADPRVVDVKVIQQGDVLYEKGKVQIVILVDKDVVDQSTVVEIVQEACNDRAFRPVGDFVTTRSAFIRYEAMEAECFVTYPLRFRPLVEARNERILREYNDYLRGGIARPIVYEEIARRLCTPDDDGVYALDVRFEGAGTSGYLQPPGDACFYIQSMTFTNYYADDEA